MLIKELWQKQPGKYFCICTKSSSGNWREHWFSRQELGEVNAFIKDYLDYDLYFCPHGFTVKRRKKEHAVPPRLLWADLDQANPNSIKPKPTIAIESSPGRFVGLWLVDKPVSDQINQKLTYAVGADKSGWDFTQVLRIPDTYNYKYPSKPKTRLLWDDGPPWRLEEIVKFFPSEVHTDVDKEVQGAELVAQDVYNRWERSIPPWVRREIMRGKPRHGKRSDMLWKLEHALLEIGMTKDEAFVLIRASPWNKFRGRKNGDEQLHRELNKVVGEHLGPDKVQIANGHDVNGQSFNWKSIDQFEIESVDWVWYPYLARGEVTIIEGDPGIGKSYIAQHLGVCIVEGRKMPSPRWAPKPKPGKVIYFDIENRPGTVTRPRLEDMGITPEGMKRFFQEDTPWTIDEEERFQEVVDKIKEMKPDIVVFDTLNTYIGMADTYKSSEAQQAFNNFRLIASEFDCAVVVLRHLTKTDNRAAIYRGQGSIAFTGVARIVISIGTDPNADDEDQRVLAVTKNNLAKRPDALTFYMEKLPDTMKRRDRMRIEWGDYVKLSVEAILRHRDEGEQKESQIPAVKELIKELLDDGPMERDKVIKALEKRGYKEAMVIKAAGELGVVKSLTGFGRGKRSIWTLSDDRTFSKSQSAERDRQEGRQWQRRGE